jgi:hypothetical protein
LITTESSHIDQTWFEMPDVRRRRLDSAVWIPLRAISYLREAGQPGHVGFEEEFFGVGTLAVPTSAEDEASRLGWSDIGIGHNHRPIIEDQRFIPSDTYVSAGNRFQGVHLVLNQNINSLHPSVWHLHSDLVLGLGLAREGDKWLSPREGYLEVARMHRKPDGSPSLIEIRSEHLKDYLCAREMGLYITSYRSRTVVTDDATYIQWPENPVREESEFERWEGRIAEIHEGGFPYGQGISVMRTGRSDIDPMEDVPLLGLPTEGETESESYTLRPSGQRLFRIQGELWRREWVRPAAVSTRIRGDSVPPSVQFITDAEGTRETRQTLASGGKWLWFRPEVIEALLGVRGGGLTWYTRDTGAVRCSPDYGVHFGMNRLGLINVYAKDIVLLPEWQQRLWAGHNIGPEGGVSEELLASQARAQPASTQAPEEYLQSGLELLRHISEQTFGEPILRKHDKMAEIAARCHRFRAVDESGLYSLAKDLARLTADLIDVASIRRLLSLSKDDSTGSLKLMERLLATRIPPETARSLLTPLVGTYELRLADAHLPSEDIEHAYRLAGVDPKAPPVLQGVQLLESSVSAIYAIARTMVEWGPVE